jgi:hypothetical protein
MAKLHLSAGVVNKLPLQSGQALFWDTKLEGFGLRVGATRKTYFVERRVNDRTVRHSIGVHGQPTEAGVILTADGARDIAIKKLGEMIGGTDLNAEKKAAGRARANQKTARAEAAAYTLKALCTDYCTWLKKEGRPSHADALNIFTNHLFDAFPQVAAKPAREIKKVDLMPVVRRLSAPADEEEEPKLATARKLRSYLRAAFACALHADSHATLPASFLAYGVDANPVESIHAIKARTDKNPLPTADLRKYWTQLRDEPGITGACLRLHVLTGGQRPAQLVRLTDKDITDTLRLLDGKGKREHPRVHLLPVTKEIRRELDALPTRGFKLSTDCGKTKIHPTSLSTWAAEVAERAGIEDFQLKRVRSGIETLLAEAGIPLHTRGQLQSHGLSGVQQASYDAYSYLAEKGQALATLLQVLDNKPAKNVRALKRA